MSAELAMIIGLGLVAYMTLRINEKFKESETMMEEAVNLLSMFFLIGLEYTGYGISTNHSLSNASDAYLVALMITVVIFLALLVKLVQRYWVETRDNSEMEGF